MRPKHLRPKILQCLLKIDNQCPWVGFALTVIVLCLLLFFHDYVDFSLSLTFIFVVLSVYMGGLWWGLASAGVVIAAEVFLLFPLGQYQRFTLVSLTLIGTVYLVAILQRKAIIGDSINGNIKALLKIMSSMQDTLEDWDLLTRDDIRMRLKQSTDGIVNVTTHVKGFHDIYLEIEQLNRKMDK